MTRMTSRADSVPSAASGPRYRVASEVAWVDSVEGQRSSEPGTPVNAGEAPEAWVAKLPDGQPLSLNGSGLAIWLACVSDAPGDVVDSDAAAPEDLPRGAPRTSEGVNPDAGSGVILGDIVQRVRDETGDPDAPEADIAGFLDQLVTAGLLERVE